MVKTIQPIVFYIWLNTLKLKKVHYFAVLRMSYAVEVDSSPQQGIA